MHRMVETPPVGRRISYDTVMNKLYCVCFDGGKWFLTCGIKFCELLLIPFLDDFATYPTREDL